MMIRLVRAFAILCFLVAASGCGESAAPALLVETTDPVSVNGKTVHALPSSPFSLAAGDALEVGPKGLARLLYPDGSRFVLYPRGTTPGRVEITPRASSAAPVVVKLAKGILAFLVPKDRKVKDRYELEALNTVTTIEGTSGRVITSKTEDRVALESGAVTVRATDGATSKLTALQEVVYSTEKKAFAVETYDPTSKAERDLYEGRGDNVIYTH